MTEEKEEPKLTGEQLKNIANATLLFFIIVLAILIAYFQSLKKKKQGELEDVRKTLEQRQKLKDALEKKKKHYFTFIRCFFMMTYLALNASFYFICYCEIGEILNWNSVFFITVSALTFARFGSFSEYNKWWSFAETGIDSYIYRESPDLKKLIENDIQYKEKLEKEIDDLNLIL